MCVYLNGFYFHYLIFWEISSSMCLDSGLDRDDITNMSYSLKNFWWWPLVSFRPPTRRIDVPAPSVRQGDPPPLPPPLNRWGQPRWRIVCFPLMHVVAFVVQRLSQVCSVAVLLHAIQRY